MASRPVSLPQLPADVLRLVWDQLGVRPGPEERHTRATVVDGARHQHALRCTCKQLRDATTPFLHALLIGFDYFEHPQPTPSEEATLQDALRQLAAFPPSASLSSLRWWYLEASDDDYDYHVRLPTLLPGFFAAARERLANVSSVTLGGHLALGPEDICSLVGACPRLQALTLKWGPLLRGALAPLVRLAGLRELRFDASPPAAAAGEDAVAEALAMYQSLTSLSTLTRLHVSGEHYAEDILPHLPGLPSLAHLSVSVLRRDPDSDVMFNHLSGLTTLHTLSLSLADLGREIGCGLALPTQLSRLDLGNAALDSAAIRLVCSLPRLARLSAGQLAPDCDLSGIACGFTQLSLQWCESPLHVVRLPLANVQLLSIDWIRWTLDAHADIDATCTTLRQACQILASRVGAGSARTRPHSHRLSLDWTRVPSPSSCRSCLAALAPVARHPHFFRRQTLILGDKWDAGSELVDQLAAHLPSLQTLWVVGARRPTFVGFATALGSKLPGLRILCVGTFLNMGSAGQLPQASQDALLALAAIRAVGGPPLTIKVSSSSMSAAQRERCNVVVELIRSGVGKTPLNEVLFIESEF